MADEHRTEHPFHMYEAIRAQPEAFARVARQSDEAVDRFAGEIASCDRLFLVGIGTSHHAALVGEFWLRTYAAGLPAQAVHSFDFALYGPPLTSRDAVVAISHRGHKTYTVESLRRARQACCRTALITGDGQAAGSALADVTFPTVGQEKSSAHTISYVGTLAVLASLAGGLGRHRTGQPPFPKAFLHDELPSALRQALATETDIAPLARQQVGRRRIWLTGGGPSAVTAQEIALKIKEAPYLQAEGLAVEAFLHGPFQCVEPEDLFVLIAPAGPAQKRLAELAAMVREVGAPYVVVSDGTPRALEQGATGWWVVPAVPEPFTALTCLVPLQLLAYHLALARGTNPDRFRLEDPRFARAHKLVQL
jgi:glucosamine--fructose-6-phosphate aminotransferase (isomerizing)